jgi:regulatory protein
MRMPIGRPKKLDNAKLWDYALAALSRRALTTGEIRSRLAARAEDVSAVPAVMAKLAEYGYLDDTRFAESFAAARLENQGLGRQRVLRDLRQRRVGAAEAEAAVEKTFDGSDEAALIEGYLRRKYRGADLAEKLRDPAKLAAAYRKLRYAGFSSGNSIRVLERYTGRARDIEDDPAGE